jgi:hypothetical protein
MQQRGQQQPAKGKKGAAPAQASAPDSTAAAAPDTTTSASSNKQIRTVGPKFLQDNSAPSVPH